MREEKYWVLMLQIVAAEWEIGMQLIFSTQFAAVANSDLLESGFVEATDSFGLYQWEMGPVLELYTVGCCVKIGFVENRIRWKWVKIGKNISRCLLLVNWWNICRLTSW